MRDDIGVAKRLAKVWGHHSFKSKEDAEKALQLLRKDPHPKYLPYFDILAIIVLTGISKKEFQNLVKGFTSTVDYNTIVNICENQPDFLSKHKAVPVSVDAGGCNLIYSLKYDAFADYDPEQGELHWVKYDTVIKEATPQIISKISSGAIESFIDFCDDMEIVNEEYKAPTTLQFIRHPIKEIRKAYKEFKPKPYNQSPKYLKKMQDQTQKEKEHRRYVQNTLRALKIEELQPPSGEMDNKVLLSYCEKAQQKAIQGIKKYTASQGFKSKYKMYIPLISIKPTNHANLFDIQITDFQSGVDFDRADQYEKSHPGISNDANPWLNNDWYYDLLYMGEAIVNEVFDVGIGYCEGTGDGDEATIYVHTVVG